MKHRIWALAAAAGLLAVPACSHPPVYVGVVARTAPASPATGSAYPYNLPVRCGIDYAFFAGHWWQADKPLPAPADAHGYPYAYGTMTLLSPGRAKFTWPGEPAVITFHPTATRPPRLRLTRPAHPAAGHPSGPAKRARHRCPGLRLAHSGNGKGSSPAGPSTARPAVPPSDPVQAGQT